MNGTRFIPIAMLALLLIGNSAQARVSHGVSGILTIDTVSAVGDDMEPKAPDAFIAAVYPNPFNPLAAIEFELRETGFIELAIFDARGRLVRTIDSGIRPLGRHRSTWDGLDDHGRSAPTGIYFCRLGTPRGSQTKKIALAR